MFKWYQNADTCLAYPSDVTDSQNDNELSQSEWFTRGWTLQELIAPRTVIFLTKDWQTIGYKGHIGNYASILREGRCLTPLIASATNIPEVLLNDSQRLQDFSSRERLKWTKNRNTTREEDKWYCLFGVLDVALGANYGEGAERARRRLFTEIDKTDIAEIPPTPSLILPFHRDEDYIAREGLTNLLVAKLSGPARKAALVGRGGNGKSQLAIEYVYRLRERSPDTWVLWSHASNQARFEQSVRDVAERVKLRGRHEAKGEIFELLWRWLGDATNGRWLVILDNADETDFLLEPPATTGQRRRYDYFPMCEHGSILITSRSMNEATKLVEHRHVIAVGPMEACDAQSLLEKKLLEAQQADTRDIAELAATLEYVPLAMTQAAAYIAQRGRRYRVRQYLEKLRKSLSSTSRTGILDEAVEDLRRDPEARNSILQTWQISFEHIYQVYRTAADLLSLMSLCDRNAIPEDLIRIKSENRKYQSNVDNASRYREDHSNYDDSDDSVHDSFDMDISTLEGYAFVSTTAGNMSMFEMHRLVQHATQQWLSSHGLLEKYTEQLVTSLCSIFPRDWYENRSVSQRLFPHARSLMQFRLGKRDAALQWAQVMHYAAAYANGERNDTEATLMASWSFQVRDEILGKEAPETLVSINMLAWAKRPSKNLKEAEELFSKVLDARSRTLAKEHPDVLKAINDLASIYWEQRRLTEAEELYIKTVEASSKTLGDDHPDTLDRMNNLATVYSPQGRWTEAEKLLITTVEASSRTLDDDHPDRLTMMNNLAMVYSDQERWAEAEKLQIKTVEASSRTLGDDHADTLGRMNNLAMVYSDQERWAEAEKLQLKTVEASSRTLGDDHADTLGRMNNLAMVYSDQERWAEAEKLQLKTVEASSKTLGDDHPDTLGRMNNLATVYLAQGRWTEAEKLQIKTVEASSRTLGDDHPETLRVKL